MLALLRVAQVGDGGRIIFNDLNQEAFTSPRDFENLIFPGSATGHSPARPSIPVLAPQRAGTEAR